MNYQVVILAGGESSRFAPFNKIHKSFFKICGKTIIERTLESVRKTTPIEIILVLGRENFDKEKEICQLNPLFKDVKFVCQESPLGQADAVLAAAEYITHDFFVINAQQFNFHLLVDKFIKKHLENKNNVTVGSIETDEPQKYGIFVIEGDKVVGIVEKPKLGEEPSNKRLVGIYLFSKDTLSELKNTEKSKYSLETTLDNFSKNGKVGTVDLDANPPSLKYPWDILEIKDLIFERLQFGIDEDAKVEKSAVIKGDKVFIGKGAYISDYAIIESPAYIGEGAVVGAFCQVRGGSVLENGAQVQRYVDLKNSYIGENAHIHSGFVGDSVVGANVRIGAGFISANKRLDRTNIHSVIKNEKIDTSRVRLGVMIGEGAKIGIRVSSMPGAIVGANSNIYPNITLKGSLKDESEVK